MWDILTDSNRNMMSTNNFSYLCKVILATPSQSLLPRATWLTLVFVISQVNELNVARSDPLLWGNGSRLLEYDTVGIFIHVGALETRIKGLSFWKRCAGGKPYGFLSAYSPTLWRRPWWLRMWWLMFWWLRARRRPCWRSRTWKRRPWLRGGPRWWGGPSWGGTWKK